MDAEPEKPFQFELRSLFKLTAVMAVVAWVLPTWFGWALVLAGVQAFCVFAVLGLILGLPLWAMVLLHRARDPRQDRDEN